MDSRCDCGLIICCCYDVSSLQFVVVMTSKRIMVVIVVLGFNNFKKLKDLYWANGRFQSLHDDETMVSALIRID